MDENAQTVANFLKFYNPSIVGGSLGHHIVEVSICLALRSYSSIVDIEEDTAPLFWLNKTIPTQILSMHIAIV